MKCENPLSSRGGIKEKRYLKAKMININYEKDNGFSNEWSLHLKLISLTTEYKLTVKGRNTTCQTLKEEFTRETEPE